jgi:dipeptidyl aminopeptidase/acylaminoacyl peptidase
MPTLLTERNATSSPPPDGVVDPDALIREARERQRRRRLRLLATALVAAATAGIVYGLVGGRGGSSPGVERVSGGPVVNVGAFSHHGALAFVSHNALWLLDGKTRALRRMPLPSGYFAPQAPQFSSDGKWLAYLASSPNGVTPSQVWLARSDGSGAHRVPGLPSPVGIVGWSPHSDLLAVIAGPQRTKQPCPCYSPTTLRLVSPGGTVRVLARSSWLDGAAWSDDGNNIAVAAITYPLTKIVAYPVAGGRGTTWLSVDTKHRLNGMHGILAHIAGWSARVGVTFWVYGDGAVRNLDATPLDAVAAPGATPRSLGQTLSDPDTTDPIATTTKGEISIVNDHGGGRAQWQDKTVELCAATGPCRPLQHAPGFVTVDPSWSPDGKTLAYAEAPNVNSGPWTQKALSTWFNAHRVQLYDADTGRTRPLPQAHGATAITWSADGRSLLYVRNDALWLLPSLTGKPVRIAAPLYPFHDWPQYFAQVAWATQFAWTSR